MFLDVAYSLTRRSIRRLLGLADREALIRELLAENMVLRQRIAVLRRTSPRPRLHRRDRVVFAALSRILPRERWGAFGFSPSTLLRWHRELVGRKCTFKRKRMGRPPIDPELAALIIRIAKDSSDWGCYRIKGELQGLGIRRQDRRPSRLVPCTTRHRVDEGSPSRDAFAQPASDDFRRPGRQVQFVTNASRQLFVNFSARSPRFGQLR